MKILAFSGLHGNSDLIKTLADSIIAKNLRPDVFVCVGDIGDSIIAKFFAEMLKFGKPIIFVLGNHTILDNDRNEVDKAKMIKNVFHLGVFSFDNYAFIGQDAWTHFTHNKKTERLRFADLSKKFRRVTQEKIVLATHHAPMGILDRGISYPEVSWEDEEGFLHSGSFSIRKIVEQFKPSIHLFAHCHSDGGKWQMHNETLFVNVCHLERVTKEGEIGVNGSFMVVDTDKNTCIPHHLSKLSHRRCSCGAMHYLNYRKCFNCYNKGETVIGFEELENHFYM